MNTGKLQYLHAVSVAEQTNNNTTSWVGLFPIQAFEISKGQTFETHTEGDLESIEVFSNLITKPGHLELSIHQFDPLEKKWSDAIGTTTVEVKKSDEGSWMKFNVPSCHLTKGKHYGFKLVSHDCLIGIGEAMGSSSNPPLTNGQEWKFAVNGQHTSFSYCSLAFKVALKAA
ncbi:MAG: hypothetical protein IPL97_00840 [Niastella sp.]|nr:hypothetical protein [Niastella sp.]